MISPRNRVLVKGLDSNRWKDRMITPGGLELLLPTMSKVETEDIKYIGEVVSVPATLTGMRKNDYQVRIKPGDIVAFNYKTMLREPVMDVDGVRVWQCDYADIFCRVDDNCLFPVGDWVLVTAEKKTIPIGSGLLINPFEEILHGQGIVHSLSPFAQNQLQTTSGPVKPGDRVFFPADQGEFENEILGLRLWCMNAEIIFASEVIEF